MRSAVPPDIDNGIKRPRRQRVSPAAPLHGLYMAVSVYLVVTIYRPQDIIAPLGLLRPGLISVIVIAALLLGCDFSAVRRDPVFRWQILFFGIMVAGLAVVTNHFYWFSATRDYLLYLIAFSVAMPLVMQKPAFRDALLKLMLGGFAFVAIWAIAHKGVGPGAWIGDENDTAAALLIGLCLAYSTWAEAASKLWRLLAIGVGLLCLVGVVVSESRGGVIGLVATVGAIVWYAGRAMRMLIFATAVVASVWFVAPDSFKAQVFSISDKQDSTRTERLYSWERGWEMLVANPLLGVGAANFPWAVGRYELTPEVAEERGGRRMIAGRVAHSLYFTLLPEMGVFGSIAYFAVVIHSLRRARRALRGGDPAKTDASIRTCALFLGPAVVGYSVASIFISTLWYPAIWMLAGLSVFLGLAGSEPSQKPMGAVKPAAASRTPVRSRTGAHGGSRRVQTTPQQS
jgi:O-antigen ligase